MMVMIVMGNRTLLLTMSLIVMVIIMMMMMVVVVAMDTEKPMPIFQRAPAVPANTLVRRLLQTRSLRRRQG